MRNEYEMRKKAKFHLIPTKSQSSRYVFTGDGKIALFSLSTMVIIMDITLPVQGCQKEAAALLQLLLVVYVTPTTLK